MRRRWLAVLVAGLSCDGMSGIDLDPMFLSAIEPPEGLRGTDVPVVLTGGGLDNPWVSIVTPAGITVVGDVRHSGDNEIDTTFHIAAAMTPGLYAIALDGHPNDRPPVKFRVLDEEPRPHLTAVSPATGQRGAAVPVTITGMHLAGDLDFAVTDANGVTGDHVAANRNDGSVMTTLHIAATAPVGDHDLVVMGPGGQSDNKLTFTVTGPVITGIQPEIVTAGTSPTLTIDTNVKSSAVTIDIAGVGTAIPATTDANGRLLITVQVPAGTSGLAYVLLTANGVTSDMVYITIESPSGPVLSSLSPTHAPPGSGIAVHLTGQRLAGGTLLVEGGSDVTIAGAPTLTDTTVDAMLDIPSTAVGDRDLRVSVGNVKSNPLTFHVDPAPPRLDRIQPNSATEDTSATDVTLTGDGFTPDSRLVIEPSGLNVTSFVVVGPTTITATFNHNLFQPGDYMVEVTNVNGTSAWQHFTIGADLAPHIDSISPTQAHPHDSPVAVTITGSRFAPDTTVAASASGISVADLVVVSDTRMTATFTITCTAVGPAHTVQAHNSNGDSNTVNFLVYELSPYLFAISPISGTMNVPSAVTIDGGGFDPRLSVILTSASMTVDNVAITSTRITARFTPLVAGRIDVQVANCGSKSSPFPWTSAP
jgi:hypothetical protein